MRRNLLSVAVALLALFTAFPSDPVRANPILTFTYSDTNGSFDSTTSIFTAVSQSVTDGDVTRLEGPATTASFDFSSALIGSALLQMTLNISNVTAGTADSTGTLLLQDVDGDQFVADVSGGWVNVAGSAHLNGVITSLVPVSSGDGIFEGTSGSFSMLFDAPPPCVGNVITLGFVGWFADAGGNLIDLRDRQAHVSGAVVPSPGTAALGLLALTLLPARRKPQWLPD